MTRRSRFEAGFTILEAVVVLGVVAALAGILVPLGFQILENRREDAAREQLLRIRAAMLGSDPSRVGARRLGGPPGGELPGTFGFAGDLGALPDTLIQLVVRDTLPAFAATDDFGLGAGWRGPYLSTGSADEPAEAFRDPFGRPIRWAKKDTTVDGILWAGFLRSGGPDRERGTADDLTVPLPADEVRGSATGFLRHGSGQPVGSAPLSYARRVEGQVVVDSLATDTLGRWQGPEHVFGPAVVTTGAPGGGPHLGHVRGLDRVSGSSFEDVSFRVVNVTDDDVVVTSYTVTWNPSATTGCYTDGRFGGVDVSGGGANRHCSGQTLSFTVPVRVPAGAAFGASVTERRFELDRPSLVAPELVVAGEAGRRGRGEALVELLDWTDSGGTPVDVRGLQLGVTFSDGSTTTFTVPTQ